jgi:hypothetical protein
MMSLRSVTRAVAAAAVLAVTASGCAMVSPSDNVRATGISAAGSGQDNPQLIPNSPGAHWTPSQIVTGFILANASFATNPGIARSFLTGKAAAKWHPSGAVTVVNDLQKSPTTGPKRQANLPNDQTTTVTVLGAQLATLTSNGQYLTSSAPGKPITQDQRRACPQLTATVRCYRFTLLGYNDTWRISNLPTSQILLTKNELNQVYQQRNLYFFDRSGKTLIPDAVFVPQHDRSAAQAQQLVYGLLKDPQGWLAGAAQTTFPIGTRLRQVQVDGTNAIVSLTMPAAARKQLKRDQLMAQLVWTLTSTSYGPNSIQSVEIQINGRTLTKNHTPYLLPQMYQRLVPRQAATSGPYFISQTGAVRQAVSPGPTAGSGGALSSSLVPGPAGLPASPGFEAIAVEPDQGELACLSGDGRTVFMGDLSRTATLSHQRLGGHVASLSWDRTGDLWAAGGRTVWLLAPASQSTVRIDLPIGVGEQVTAFKVAPDGTRVAMITTTSAGKTQLMLAAINGDGPAANLGQAIVIGTETVAPTSLTWYDADHLIALTNPGNGAQLEEIPLNGGTPIPVSTQPGAVSVSGDGSGLVAGLNTGQIYVTAGLDSPWQQVGARGRSPVYPG